MTVALLDPELPHGTLLGKYEILRKLATGGMAEIYLARTRGIVGFEKLVVLKRILPNVAEDPSFVQMFLDEARLAATLQHPNIADVYDVGSENNTFFFTMEFIHGEDARSIRIFTRRKGEPLPLSHMLAIVHGTASALIYAHNKSGPDGPLGLVHRDVSSSNILVSFDGAVKLVDFGIARATSRQTKTRTGTLKGKIPYMSPEQCRNLPLDRRSDLFSLGVVLYELSTGRRPFRGNSDFDIFDHIINKGATPPSELDRDYPPELERIVMKMLSRKPKDRYQTGEDLLVDLEQVMSSRNAWVSPATLGRYMRTLFADKVEAWENALKRGATLGDHVASTATSESMRALRTTPLSITVQPEPPEISEEDDDDEDEDDAGDAEAALEAPTAVTPSAAVIPPAPSRSRRGVWIGVAAGLVGVAVVVVLVLQSSEPSTLGASPTPAPTPTTVTPAKTTVPTPPARTTTPAPTASEPTPPSKPSEASATKPTPEEVRPPPPPVVTVKPVAKPKPTKPRPGIKKDKPKETTWDRNSLTLPD